MVYKNKGEKVVVTLPVVIKQREQGSVAEMRVKGAPVYGVTGTRSQNPEDVLIRKEEKKK